MVGALQWSLVKAFGICGTRLLIERSPQVKPYTPYLVIANHQSLFDIPIFGALLFTNFPKYISKRSLASWIPSISYNLRRGGNALIDRSDPEQAVAAIEQLAGEVRARGVAAVIFQGARAAGMASSASSNGAARWRCWRRRRVRRWSRSAWTNRGVCCATTFSRCPSA